MFVLLLVPQVTASTAFLSRMPFFLSMALNSVFLLHVLGSDSHYVYMAAPSLFIKDSLLVPSCHISALTINTFYTLLPFLFFSFKAIPNIKLSFYFAYFLSPPLKHKSCKGRSFCQFYSHRHFTLMDSDAN